jgi:uncharacterized membrane protein YraQ (UPF0718 family)
MKLTAVLKRYRGAVLAVILFAAFILAFPSFARKAEISLLGQLSTMLLVVLMKYMGEGSGLRGAAIAFVLGSAAAGPLYGAFPVSAVLMKKGASFSNVLIFIGAWSTTKIPMLLFEMNALGVRFALSRLLIDIPGIVLIALALKVIIPKHEIERLYAAAETVD